MVSRAPAIIALHLVAAFCAWEVGTAFIRSSVTTSGSAPPRRQHPEASRRRTGKGSRGAPGLACTLADGVRMSPMPLFSMEDAISPLVASIAPSKTIAVHAMTKEMEARGEKVVSLCVGEPDFPPPTEVIEATAAAARQGRTKYTGVTGDVRLRKAISQDLLQRKGIDYAPSEIIISNGAKQSVYQAVLTVVRPGDEVIIAAPYWPSYPEIVRMTGGTPVIVDTTVDEGYLLSPEGLAAAITPRTRMLIFCNPSNPTGAVHSKERCEELVAAIMASPAAAKMWVLSDEIYERIVYGVPHVCFAALPGMQARTMLVNGFSKSHAMTGYRVGYLAAPPAIIAAVTTIQGQITSCASSISQEAALAALEKASDDGMARSVEEMRGKRDFVLGRLQAIPDVKIAVPDGAFYALPDVSAYFGKSTPSGNFIGDSNDLCLQLLKEHKVALVAGDGFGCPMGVRISYATSMEDLEYAMDEFEKCLSSLR